MKNQDDEYGPIGDDQDAREDVYEHMTRADLAFNERLDYASHCRESGDWRDPGEIRMGA